MRKPYANGTTDFLFSEVELAQRLAALVPPARKNGMSYHVTSVPGADLRSTEPIPPSASARNTTQSPTRIPGFSIDATPLGSRG